MTGWRVGYAEAKNYQGMNIFRYVTGNVNSIAQGSGRGSFWASGDIVLMVGEYALKIIC